MTLTAMAGALEESGTEDRLECEAAGGGATLEATNADPDADAAGEG